MFQQSPLTLRNTPSGRDLIAEEVAELLPDLGRATTRGKKPVLLTPNQIHDALRHKREKP